MNRECVKITLAEWQVSMVQPALSLQTSTSGLVALVSIDAWQREGKQEVPWVQDAAADGAGGRWRAAAAQVPPRPASH